MKTQSEPTPEPPAAPPAPRHAASLLLLKPSPEGLRILMGMRHADHKFMPNKLVFPGGAVDAADYTAQPGRGLAAHVRQKLARAGGLALADALGAACARELQEETGLTLGEPPLLDQLDYLCRAVTPANRPIRFDARFFVADAACASGTLAGSGELEALDWYELAAVLRYDLAEATRAVLSQLQIWLDLAVADRPARKVPALLDRIWQEE